MQSDKLQDINLNTPNFKPFKKLVLVAGIFTFISSLFVSIVKISIPYNGVLFLFNLSFSVIYFTTIYLSLKRDHHSERRLVFYLLLFCTIGVLIYNMFFYMHGGTLLQFNPMDAGLYYEAAINLSKESIGSILKFSFLDGIDDAGYPIYSALIYKLIPSNLAVNFMNIIINVFTTLMLYRIGKEVLTNKLAFTAAIIYGISSYSIFYQASGLKETIMIFFIISSFYHYTKYIKTNKPIFLFNSIILGGFVIFFRVALVLFILLSYFINEVVRRGVKWKFILPGIIFCLLFFYIFYNYFGSINDRFINTIEYILFIKSSESSYISSGSILFSYTLSIISGLFGPFPNIVPVAGREALSIFSGGLILKILLSSYFVYSIRFLWKERNYIILPIVLFCILEIMGLSYLLESFELRKAIPHFGLFIIVSVYSYEQIHKKNKSNSLIKKSILLLNVTLAVMIIFWNVLRV